MRKKWTNYHGFLSYGYLGLIEKNMDTPSTDSNISNHISVAGGFNLPLWKMMDFVTWDDDIHDIPNMMGKS